MTAITRQRETRILWISEINELDFLAQMIVDSDPRYRIYMGLPFLEVPAHFPVKAHFRGLYDIEKMDAAIRKARPDLIVTRCFRRPYMLKEIVGDRIPIVFWLSEPGEGHYMDYQLAKHYNNVFFASRPQLRTFQSRYGGHYDYFPFCMSPSFHKPLRPSKKYAADLVCCGNPRYGFFRSKSESVDVMIRPLLDDNYDLALWGAGAGDGWSAVPGVAERHYRGEYGYRLYPKILAGARIVLGLNGHYRFGAYADRLATTLGCGKFLIWHYTEGMEEDFENHRELVWVKDHGELVDLTDHYLRNSARRRSIAARGRKFALEHLNYKTLLPRLFENLVKNATGNFSRYDTDLQALITARSSGDFEGAAKIHNAYAGEQAFQFHYGTMLLENNKWREGHAVLRRSFERENSLVENLNNLAVACRRLGYDEKCAIILEKCKSESPDFRDGSFNFEMLSAGGEMRLTRSLRRY